ncbi:23S rRNA (adenine(2503)-C(2))-methyltransferase RlmN [Spiroplasma citri]|uniref:Probable dual-specificity RNA methyltransferase RlmN n=1 Tax=Spiroplasma citri TaxID=2133 RepID=A0AAX3SXU1_SPICI|nr:23S rRNA (adenine(2503)-C(2))-methyltransferase RlmN [Spiroplasma citri]WFG96085.1 23S rRNA (adenine(2503)-C(2))-methyltransferase RlmN [Spiroplasma citri]WFG99972.1 23S rRNA (adenine(2503)-C(2))-methyltransferase RlmN [Spiroplasma citri]
MTSIFGYPKEELQLDLVAHGFKKYLAEQIFDWIYVKNIYSFDEMTNISKTDRNKLQEYYTIEPLKIVVQQQSKDGTVKFLFQLADGYKIETVLMPQSYGNSVCVTTQVGCNMVCTFCASGLLKKTRNLSTAEIVQQVMMVNRYLATTNERVSHIVVMGIGEPFDNFDNTLKFVNIINDPKGYQIGARHITISTCGLVPKIKQFAELKMQVNLAISLHAPNNTIRNQLMPINKAYPVEKLMDAVRYYIELTNRRVTFEYILIENVNDSRETVLELAKLIRGLNAYVNLIPYNTVAENGYQRSTKINQFFETLQQQKINCIVRREFGHDIDAACGQLRAKNEGVIRK